MGSGAFRMRNVAQHLENHAPIDTIRDRDVDPPPGARPEADYFWAAAARSMISFGVSTIASLIFSGGGTLPGQSPAGYEELLR